MCRSVIATQQRMQILSNEEVRRMSKIMEGEVSKAEVLEKKTLTWKTAL